MVNHPVTKFEISALGISAECDPFRRERRQIVPKIDHGKILRRLILKNPQLGGAIFFHRRVAVEMVGREVQPDCDSRAEIANLLELK